MEIVYGPLRSVDIKNILSRDPRSKHKFLGVYAADTLPLRVPQRPCALVVNMDTSNLPGSHWVAIYVRSDGVGEYFDSYGLAPLSKHHIKFLDTACSSWTVNKVRLQGIYSSVCGQYCCLFVAARSRNTSMKRFTSSFADRKDDASNDAKCILAFRRRFLWRARLGQRTKPWCDMSCSSWCACAKEGRTSSTQLRKV